MLKKKRISLSRAAFQNIRHHFFRTVLSIPGIIIGVAALVAILSVIDDGERYAKDRIRQATSLETIFIKTGVYEAVNGVTVRKDTVSTFHYNDLTELRKFVTRPAKINLVGRYGTQVSFSDDSTETGVIMNACVTIEDTWALLAGRKFTEADVRYRLSEAVVNESFARAVLHNRQTAELIGRKIVVGEKAFQIIGVINNGNATQAEVYCPITLFSDEDFKWDPPSCIVEAADIADVPELKAQVSDWLKTHFEKNHDFIVQSNDHRVEIVMKGFWLARCMMALIIGISIMVGGFGMMNLLLISLSERRIEIGMQKAAGVSKLNIFFQFLCEAITISGFGSFLGLIAGVLSVMAGIPLIKTFTGIQFQVACTWNIFIAVAVLSVVTGILFGMYPALRAAFVSPVKGSRRELPSEPLS